VHSCCGLSASREKDQWTSHYYRHSSCCKSIILWALIIVVGINLPLRVIWILLGEQKKVNPVDHLNILVHPSFFVKNVQNIHNGQIWGTNISSLLTDSFTYKIMSCGNTFVPFQSNKDVVLMMIKWPISSLPKKACVTPRQPGEPQTQEETGMLPVPSYPNNVFFSLQTI